MNKDIAKSHIESGKDYYIKLLESDDMAPYSMTLIFSDMCLHLQKAIKAGEPWQKDLALNYIGRGARTLASKVDKYTNPVEECK